MITREELVAGFQQIPLTESRTIMVHSSYKSLGGVAGGAETVINALLDYVGPEGTVLFATFNFDTWTQEHYFDVKETPSKMGIIGELARLRPDALRTPHPLYSFAALGKDQEAYAACEDEEAYGPNSVFARFHEQNGMIVSIGLHWNSTFSLHHYVEYNVGCDYRRIKRFSGVYVGYDGTPRLKTYTMFVRQTFDTITDIVPAMDELLAGGVIKETPVGEAAVHYATASDFFNNMSVIVQEHPEKCHRIKDRKFV